MIRYLFNRMLRGLNTRYNYDVRYQQDILQTDLTAFLKFMGFQTMATHSGNLPAGPLYAARLRAILRDDCGPCTQLLVDLALEAELEPSLIQAIIDLDYPALPEEIALVTRFTERVLDHDPEADDLRDQVLERWGQQGVITLGLAISAYRVYPALKYSLGYGKACSRIQVKDRSVTPAQQSTAS